MRRAESHKIDEQAQRVFRAALPLDWVMHELHPDYGLDYRVEIYEDGEATGKEIAVQLKGTTALRRDERVVRFPLATDHLAYYVDKRREPVFLVVVDVQKSQGYWVFLQGYALDELHKTPWRSQKTITIRIPAENDLRDTARLQKAVEDSLVRFGSTIVDMAAGPRSIVQDQGTRLTAVEHLSGTEVQDEDIQEAVDHIRRREFAGALVLLERIRDRRWDSLDHRRRYHLLANMGLVYQATDRYEKAADLFVEAKAFWPEREQARFFEAMAWIMRGQDDKAFELACSIVEDLPQSALGWASWIRSAPPTEAYETILARVPSSVRGDAEVEGALAQRASLEESFDTAVAHLRRALQDSDANPEVLAQLGTALLQSVVAPLKQSLASLPRPSILPLLGEAVTFLDKALVRLEVSASKERCARLLLNRSIGHSLLGNTQTAERDIEEAYHLASDVPEVAIQYAQLRVNRGDISGGITTLTDARNRQSTSQLDVILALLLDRRDSAGDRDEAISILEGRLANLDHESSDVRRKCVAALCQVYVNGRRYEDAEKVLQSAVPTLITEIVRTVLRAYIAEQRGDPDTARSLLLQVFPGRADLEAGEPLVSFASHLQRLRLYEEALAVWKDIVGPEVFGPHTMDLLLCAEQVGDDKTILDLCESLRANGFEQWRCIELEAATLAKYGEYESAIQLLQQGITKAQEEKVQRYLRLQLSVLGLQLKRPDLVEQDREKLPSVEEIPPERAPSLAAVLRNGPDPAEAARFAYAIVRRHFHKDTAHAAMIGALMGPWGPDVKLPESTTVEPGFAAYHREQGDDAGDPSFFIIEDDDSPDQERQELAPAHPIAVQLMGKKVGDEFTLNPGSIQEQKAVVVEITHKYVARLRDSMRHWERRFPDRFFVQQVKLQKTPDGSPDVTPILRSIDRRAQAAAEVERTYQQTQVPLHIFNNLLGGSVFDSVRHIAGSPHLRLRCCSGREEERDAGLKMLADAKSVIVDATVLASLFVTDMVELLAACDNLVVSQGTLDVLEEYRAKLSERPQGGFLGKYGDRYVLTDYQNKAVQEQNRQDVARLDAIIEAVTKHCRVRSGLPLAELSPELRRTLVKLFGQPGAESIAIAREHGGVLWADEFAMGPMAAEVCRVGRVCTHVVAQYQAQRGHIEKSRFLTLFVRLVEAGYSFTSISADLVVHVAQLCEWNPDRVPLQPVLDELSRPELNPKTLFGVVGRSLALLWRSQVLEGQAAGVTIRFLERLANRPRGHAMINAIERQLEGFFGLDAIGCEAAHQTIRAWRASGHRIIVP